MSTTKIEFAVQMTCESCVKDVNKVLESVPGVKNVEINLLDNSVVVESNLQALDIQKKLESTGKKVVIRGYSGSIAGVSILDCGEKKIKGVVRFTQATPKTCIIDGTVDGLSPGKHSINVHECGDISQGCTSVGEIYSNLGLVVAENNGRSSFRLENSTLKLTDIIGRSFVVGEKRIACGIIARSAGLFQNPKTICACDGVTIWDEKTNPKAAL